MSHFEEHGPLAFVDWIVQQMMHRNADITQNKIKGAGLVSPSDPGMIVKLIKETLHFEG